MARRCILVVDDEEDIRDSVRDVLEACLGSRIRTAGDGLQGLEVLADEGSVELIITDYRMPRMDGAEFAMRAGREFGPVPILMLTACAPPDPPQEATVLTKPFDIPTLLAAVEDLLSSACEPAEAPFPGGDEPRRGESANPREAAAP